MVCAPRCSARKTGGWSTHTSRFGNGFPIHNAEGNVRAMLDHDLGAYLDVLLAAQQAAGSAILDVVLKLRRRVRHAEWYSRGTYHPYCKRAYQVCGGRGWPSERQREKGQEDMIYLHS